MWSQAGKFKHEISTHDILGASRTAQGCDFPCRDTDDKASFRGGLSCHPKSCNSTAYGDRELAGFDNARARARRLFFSRFHTYNQHSQTRWLLFYSMPPLGSKNGVACERCVYLPGFQCISGESDSGAKGSHHMSPPSIIDVIIELMNRLLIIHLKAKLTYGAFCNSIKRGRVANGQSVHALPPKYHLNVKWGNEACVPMGADMSCNL